MEKRPKSLTGKQRRQLKALAHHLDPLVRVGQGGVEAGVMGAVEQALDDHELIKIKVLEGCPVGRAEVASQLAEQCGAHLVGQLGRIAILFRRHAERPQVPLQ